MNSAPDQTTIESAADTAHSTRIDSSLAGLDREPAVGAELYCARTVKRIRRTSAKVAQLDAQIVERTVEAEAMPAHILRSIVRERIESLLPANALAISKVAEQSEREHLRRIATLMEGGKI